MRTSHMAIAVTVASLQSLNMVIGYDLFGCAFFVTFRIVYSQAKYIGHGYLSVCPAMHSYTIARTPM